MTNTRSAAARAAINRLPAGERFDLFVDEVTASGSLWSLANGDDWVVMGCDGDECLPLWPDADFAADFAIGDWADCTARAISLEVFVSRWIAGLTRDGTLLAVFPNDGDEGIVITPDELAESLRGDAGR